MGGDSSVLIGAQKSTIAEQLVRTEGYEVSSRIVNGMSRTVDVLGLIGLWGSDDASSASMWRGRSMMEDALEFSGSKSDISFQKRLQFQQMTQAGIAYDTVAVTEGAGSKILSARERLAGSTGGPSGSTRITTREAARSG